MPALKLIPTAFLCSAVSPEGFVPLSRCERTTAWLPTTGVLEARRG